MMSRSWDGKHAGFDGDDPEYIADDCIGDRAHSTRKSEVQLLTLVDALHAERVDERSHKLQQCDADPVEKSGQDKRSGKKQPDSEKQLDDIENLDDLLRDGLSGRLRNPRAQAAKVQT